MTICLRPRLSPATANAARYPTSSIDPGRTPDSRIALLNRVNSQPDGVKLPSQLPSDRRLARSRKPREDDEHGPHLHWSRDTRRRLARTPLQCRVKPVRSTCSSATCWHSIDIGRIAHKSHAEGESIEPNCWGEKFGDCRRQTSPFAVVSHRFPPYRSHACMTGAPSGVRP